MPFILSCIVRGRRRSLNLEGGGYLDLGVDNHGKNTYSSVLIQPSSSA